MSDVRGKKKKDKGAGYGDSYKTTKSRQLVWEWVEVDQLGESSTCQRMMKDDVGFDVPLSRDICPHVKTVTAPSSNPLAYFPNLCLNAAPSAFALNTFLFYCHLGFPSQPVTPLNESVLAIFSPPLPISFPSIFTLSVIPPPGLSRLALHYFPVFRAALTCVVVFGLNLNQTYFLL